MTSDFNSVLEAVRGRSSLRSVVMDAGSRGTTAHAHQCCIFQSYAKSVLSRMNMTMREPANHDNGQGVTASDVILQQRISSDLLTRFGGGGGTGRVTHPGIGKDQGVYRWSISMTLPLHKLY